MVLAPATEDALGVLDVARALRTTTSKLKAAIKGKSLAQPDLAAGHDFALWRFSRKWLEVASAAVRDNPAIVSEARYGRKTFVVEKLF